MNYSMLSFGKEGPYGEQYAFTKMTKLAEVFSFSCKKYGPY